jgi:hypothetical protein
VTGAFVSIEQPGGIGQPAPGTTGTWSFVVKVQACENLFGVTAQGGANGWSDVQELHAVNRQCRAVRQEQERRWPCGRLAT